MIIEQEDLYEALYTLCLRIEQCGASVQLTNAVSLASDLMSAVGNTNTGVAPSSFALERVKEAIRNRGF